MTAGKNRSDRVLCSVSRASAGLTTEYLIVSSKPPTGYYVDRVLCPVSRASAGLTTEYLIVSSKPPTGYYVDRVLCPVSRASAGLTTEYLIVSNLEPLALEIVCHHPILETHLVIHAHQTTIPRSYT